MYTQFYNLAERPFELTPDPRYLFLSSRHREALAHLTYAVEERRGFVQLTGEIGTGKTMMLDALVLGLDARTKVAQLSHTTISEDEFFDFLISELGLEYRGSRKLERLREIQQFLDEWTAAGRNSVLVVDEAQNLSLPVLEEIRLLSNLRSQGQCSLQIVLAGQPEFRTMLDQEGLRQLKQRIGIRYHLTPLSAAETGEYIAHRLNVAGARGSTIFDRGAVDAVFTYAGGVPRMINIVCDRALVAGYGDNSRRIGKALILETVQDIEGAEFRAPVVAASSDAAPARTIEVRDAAPPTPVSAATPEATHAEAQVAPESADVGQPAPDPERRHVPDPSRALPGRARLRVLGVPTKRRAVPVWVVPTVLVVAAVAVVAFSAVRVAWWRTLASPWDGGSEVVSVVDREAPVDVGGSGAGEDGEVSGSGVRAGAVSEIGETSVDEADAVEADHLTGAKVEDAGAGEPADVVDAGAGEAAVAIETGESGEAVVAVEAGDHGEAPVAVETGASGEATVAVDAGVGEATAAVEAGDHGEAVVAVETGDHGDAAVAVDAGVGEATVVVDTGDPGEATAAIETGDPGGVTTAIVTGDLGETSAAIDTGDPGGVTTAIVTGDPGEVSGAVEETVPRDAGTSAAAWVEPESVSVAHDRPAISGPGGPYRAIVLSSINEDAALAELSRVAELGFSVEMIAVYIRERGLWYRVAVRGGYPTLAPAREVVEELRRLGYNSAWVHTE